MIKQNDSQTAELYVICNGNGCTIQNQIITLDFNSSNFEVLIAKSILLSLGHTLEIKPDDKGGVEFRVIINILSPKINNKAVDEASSSKIIDINAHNDELIKPDETDEINKECSKEEESMLNKKVIISCDDSKFLLDAVRKLLIKNEEINFNYDIIDCYDGIDVLSKVIEDHEKDKKIEIIIINEHMQFMNGSTAISNLRRMEKEYRFKYEKKLFIVSLTAFDDEESLNNIKNQGISKMLFIRFITLKFLCQLANLMI